MLINILIQLTAIFAYQYYAIVWPLYIVMGLLTILIFVQTFAAAGVFSGLQTQKLKKTVPVTSVDFLAIIAYAISCYHIFLMEYVIFAAVALTHLAITLLTLMLRSIKQ